MWSKAQNVSRSIHLFDEFENPEEVKRIAELIRGEQWRLQNILKNQAPSPADRAKIVAGKTVQLEQVDGPIQVDSTIAEMSIKISDAFALNEMQALDLVITADIQRLSFSGLGIGLVAVVLYYDTHRVMIQTLRTLLEWTRKEELSNALSSVIKSSFQNRGVFRHLLDLAASFNVHNEFHTLATKHQGLGNTLHQNILRSLIEETHKSILDCVYLIASASDFGSNAVSDLLPLLKKLQTSERFTSTHATAWIALLSTISPKALQQAPTESSSVLKTLMDEVRNETSWGDISLCGSIQLAVAVAVRKLQLSPLDHAAAASFDEDMDILVGRSIANLAFRFIRLCVINNDGFHTNETNIQIVDALLKNFVLLFPPKLMEVVRHSEDELAMVDECAARGATSAVQPALHLDHLLRAIKEIYAVRQPTEQSDAAIEDLLDELSAQFGMQGSPQLVQFCEMATRPQHALHSVAFLDLLHAICRTRGTARSLFDIFYQIGPNDDGWVGWEQLMGALRAYERLFRDGMILHGMNDGGMGGVKKEIVNMEKSMHAYELAGLISWINLATRIVELDSDASTTLCEERGWNVVELAASLVAAPIPLTLKGPLLRLLGALGARKAASARVWSALASYRVCAYDENGQIGGIQRELEETECAQRDYPSTLGCSYMLRSLFTHPLPAAGHSFLVFLTRSVLSPLGQRSYNNVHQMWDLATTSLEALYNLVRQTHADTFAISKRLPQVKVLLELLNDSPLFRSIASIISEDVNHSLLTHTLHRPSSNAALAALRLVLAAVHKLNPLRSAIRAADSDAMLATLESLFLAPFGQPDRGCLLTHIAHYISKSIEQPLHGLYAARLLRELSAVRPSLHTRIVHMLKISDQLHHSLIRSIRQLLSVHSGPVRYSIDEVNFILSSVESLDESDLGMVHGETARILLEVMAEGAEVDVTRENLASFMLGYEQDSGTDESLFTNDAVLTGVHSMVDLLDIFIDSPDPLSLPYSALFEPVFRLLLRLVSVDAPRRDAFLRSLRSKKIIYRLLKSPFLKDQAYQLMDDTRYETAPTVSSVSSMITGDILHLAAIELSFLLSTGQIEQPRMFYDALLETHVDCPTGIDQSTTLHGDKSTTVIRHDTTYNTTIAGTAPLLFSLLRNGRIGSIEAPSVVPSFTCFDSAKVQKLLDSCRGSAVFDVELYDVAHVHWLLEREILSINMDDATQPVQEMEAILSSVAALNAALLASGASSVLLAGCVTLLNVFAVHSPVPFLSHEPQLVALLDASTVLIEAATVHVNDDVSELVADTLFRVSRSSCALTRLVTTSDSLTRRSILARLLQPLIELIVEPAERSIPVKLSLYGALGAFLRECATATAMEEAAKKKKEAEDGEDKAGLEWLLAPLGEEKKDPVREAISSLSTELVNCVTRDILDLPIEHAITAVRVLQSLLEEDSLGSRRLCDTLAGNGTPRALLELAATMEMTMAMGEVGRNDAVDVVGGDQPMTEGDGETRGLQACCRKAVDAFMGLFTRMALSSDSLWRSLSDLAAPEVFMQLNVVTRPPKQLFLDPTSINKKGSESFEYAHTLSLVLRACVALMSNPSWKTLSFQVIALIDSLTDLLNQLMRAEVQCEVLTTSASLVQFIYQHDDVCRPQVDNSRTLTSLRQRPATISAPSVTGHPSAKTAQPSFATPSRLFASLNAAAAIR